MNKTMKTLVLCSMFAGVCLTAYALPPSATDYYNRAKTAEDSGQQALALTLYLQADSAYVAQQETQTADYALCLHLTGRAYFNNNQLDKGREYTWKAVLLREQLFGRTSKQYLSSLNNYALSYLFAGDYKTALTYQKQVVELCQKMSPANSDEGMYLINLGRIYHGLNNENKATECVETALTKVEKHGRDYEYSLNFLWSIYNAQGDQVNEKRIMSLIDEHNKWQVEQPCDEYACHLDRADYYTHKGDYAKARDEFNAVFTYTLTDAQKVDAYEKYAQFLSYNVRDYAQAGEYYSAAAISLQNVEGESEAVAKLNQQAGLCYLIGKEYDKCITAHRKVVNACTRYGYSEKLMVVSMQGIGKGYSVLKDYPNAITAYRDLISFLEKNGRQQEADYAKAYERLATAEKFNKDYDQSIEHYNLAISLFNTLGMADEQESAETGLAMCKLYAHKSDAGNIVENAAAMQQRAAKTRSILKTTLSNVEQSANYLGKLSYAQSLSTAAGSYALLEDYDNALAYYAQYIVAIREAICEDFLLKSPKDRALVWAQERKTFDEIGSLITLVSKGSEQQYQQLSALIYEGQLLSKGILLSSNVEFDKILQRYGTEAMRTKYADIQNNLSRIEQMRQSKDSLESILALTRQTDALQLSLSRECTQFGNYTDYLKIDRASVVAALKPDEVAIEFATLDAGFITSYNVVVAVLVSNEFPEGIIIPVTDVKTLKTMIADDHCFATEEYGQKVWSGILQAAAGKKKIYFAPDGLLNNIGIEYLQVNGAPLCEQIDVERISSTKELCRTHTQHSLQYAALFGDVDYTEEGTAATEKRVAKRRGEFGNLENTGREVAEIKNILDKARKSAAINLYKGVAASSSEFRSQEQMPVNLLHIATHGKYDDSQKAGEEESMSRSYLVFAGANLAEEGTPNDALVTAADIAGMSLQECDMVVLSACESGLGKLGDDGVFGLQRGFKNAGVQTLLVSLSKVADAATADMMIAFYKYRYQNGGLTLHEALRRAQMEIRTQYPDDNTWASFILIDAFDN